MFDLFRWLYRNFCWCCTHNEYTEIVNSFYEVNYENVGSSSSDEEQEVTDSLLGRYREASPVYNEPSPVYNEPSPVYSDQVHSDPEPISDSDTDSEQKTISPEPYDHNFQPINDTEFEMGMTMHVLYYVNDREVSESSERTENTNNTVIINSYRDDPIERIPAPSPGKQI
jgi:hypothetical protein